MGCGLLSVCAFFFFFQAEDGIRDLTVTGVQTCALPILAQGRFADRLIVFARRYEREALFVVVPRLTASLGCPPIGLVWEDTAVTPPSFAQGEWRDVLTGRDWRVREPIPVAELLSDLPLSILAAKT